MRIFSVSAAYILAHCLYLPLPRAKAWLDHQLLTLYRRILARFTRKSGAKDEGMALLFFLLILSGVSALFGAIHPAAAAVVMIPLFTGLSVLPECVKAKDTLDSGAYARDIPAYEAIVRERCAALAPAFVGGVCAPLLLCCIGTPLYLGCALGWAYAALVAVGGENAAARRALALLARIADAVFSALLFLCAGLVGRNPLRTTGRGAQDRLVHILGVAGDHTDTRAPMSGDILQGVFLCCFCAALLLLMLTLTLFALSM